MRKKHYMLVIFTTVDCKHMDNMTQFAMTKIMFRVNLWINKVHLSLFGTLNI